MKNLLVIIGLMISAGAFAQSDDINLAEQYYSNFSYGKAIPLYEKVLAKHGGN